MNNKDNNISVKPEEGRIGTNNINNKFHAQKYITIPKINVFKKSEDSLKLPKPKPKNNSLSQQSITEFITDNRRSCDSQITSSGSKSLQQRNDKRLHDSSCDVSKSSSSCSKESSNRENIKKKPRLDQKQSSSSQKKDVAALPPSPSRLQQNLSLPLSQRTIPRPRPTQSRCNHNAKLKTEINNVLQRTQHQSSVEETSLGSQKKWTDSQTPEQQLEIMKYWLDKYHHHNRFDPAISDLTSGKPWNEIEGKLLSQFMPVFKRYLSNNFVNPRTTEFYSLFFTALQEKHKIAVKGQEEND